MADDKIQLVTKDGTNDTAVEEPPPQYTPQTQQYVRQTVIQQPQYGQPVVQQYHQPPQVMNQYGQPVAQQPVMAYNQPGMQQYMHQPAAPGQQQTVVVTQPQQQTVVIQAQQRPPTYMWLACVVFWLCNPLVGTIAFILSLVSSGAADDNRMDEAKNYGKASLWTSVIGMILGVIGIIVIIVLVVKAANDTEDAVEHWAKTYNDYDSY